MPIKRRIFKKGQSSSRFLDKSGVGNKQNRFITSNNEYNDKNGSKAKAAVVTALATTALVGTTAVYYYTSKPEDKITKTEKEAVLYARSLQATDSTTFQLSNCGDLDVDKNKRQINLTMLDGNSLGTIGTINPEGTIEIQTNDGNRNYKIVYYTNQEDDQYVKIDYQSGMVTTLLKEGSTDVTAKIFNDDESEVYEATCNLKVPKQNMVEYYFVNANSSIFYPAGDSSQLSPHNAIVIMKTLGGKYVLLDTGSESTYSVKTIYEFLDRLQKDRGAADPIVLDYLIISHMHSDHVGGLKELLSYQNLVVKHIIFKEESKTHKDEKVESYFDDSSEIDELVPDDGDGEIDININEVVDTNTFATGRIYINESDKLYVDEYLTLDFFNTSDIFADVQCKFDSGSVPYKLTLRGVKNLGNTDDDDEDEQEVKETAFQKFKIIDSNGNDLGEKYVYINGVEFLSGIYKYHYSDTIINPPVTEGECTNASGEIKKCHEIYGKLDTYFYFGAEKKRPCGKNTNSYAILAITNTQNGNRYAYFPNDIENAGSEVMPNAEGIFGSNTALYYTTIPEFIVEDASTSTVKFSNKNLLSNQSSYYKPQESISAKKARKYMDENGGKLVFYQAAHHAYNNSLDAIASLGLVKLENNKPVIENKNDVYTIFSMRIPVRKSKNFSQARSWYYLSGTSRHNVGGTSNNEYTKLGRADGMRCYISNSSKATNYECNYINLPLDSKEIAKGQRP